MRVKKEAIVGDKEAVQELIDSLAEKVSFSQWPGEIELGGDIQPMLEGFLNEAFSMDYPEINNSLKLFTRVSTARRVFDTLSSIEPVWLVNNTQIDKSNSWADRVNKSLSVPKTFAEVLPVTLRFNSFNYTLIEYNGSIRIGGNYRKDKENFGISMKLDMELKYASAEDYYVKLDPHNTNRFQDLDFDSRKLEYTKVQHTPFKSLFKLGKDLPLFRKSSTSIKPSNLSSLAILAYNGNIEGSLTGIQGDEKKTDRFFSENKYYTKIEIEGLPFWNGKTGSSIEQPRLMSTLINEVLAIPKADLLNRVACDIQVFTFDQEDNIVYKQLGTLGLRLVGNDICGTIIEEKQLVKVNKPASIDFERLERDNIKIKDIQSKFEDYINRSTSITYKPDTKDFDLSVLSFIKELPNVLLTEEEQSNFVFRCYLDKDPVDILTANSLDQVKSWKEFKSEISWYDYSSSTTEEFVFDLNLEVIIPSSKKEEVIIKYNGTLAIEFESPIKTNLTVSLKAEKLRTTVDRDYIPKSPVNRFADLDY
jgi:hypothetical protein